MRQERGRQLRGDMNADVVAVKILPDGPRISLSSLVRQPAREHSLHVGKGEFNDIVIRGNPEVADTHCILLWSQGRLEVRDYAPDKLTEFNDIALVDGHALLRSTNVLSIGSTKQVTHIMACGEGVEERPQMPVKDMPELVGKAPAYLGSNKTAAARAIGLDRITYARRLAKLAGVAALLCAVLGGATWMAKERPTSNMKSDPVEATRPTTGEPLPAASAAPAALRTDADAMSATTSEEERPSTGKPVEEATPQAVKPRRKSMKRGKSRDIDDAERQAPEKKARVSNKDKIEIEPPVIPGRAEDSRFIGVSHSVRRGFTGVSYSTSKKTTPSPARGQGDTP